MAQRLYAGATIVKDPEAEDWPKGLDWTAYLAEIGASETISTSVWAVSGLDAELVASDASIVVGNRKTQLKLSGGTRGRRYVVTNTITTSSGVIDERSFTVHVEDR